MAVDAPPWFPFYVKDFLTDEKVLAMPNEQVGLYVKLLCLQWIEGSIPADPEDPVIRKFSHAADVAPAVLTSCFSLIGLSKRRANRRLAKIRKEQILIHQRLTERSQKANAARWHPPQGLLMDSLDDIHKESKQSQRRKPPNSAQIDDGTQIDLNLNQDLNPKSNAKKESIGKERIVKERKPLTLSDEEFLAFLRASPAYQHFSVDVELAKIDAWLLTHPREHKTRRRIVNWLNNVPAPMGQPVPVKPPEMSAAQRKMEAKEAELRRLAAEKEAAT